MSMYSVLVFLHIVGALGLFASIAIEQASLARLRRASTGAQVREWLGVIRGLGRLHGPAGLLLLSTGFYFVATRWGHQAWIGLAIPGMLLMAVLGAAVTGRRVKAIATELAASAGPIPPGLRHRLDDPELRLSVSIRAALGLGIVFNMAVKPAAGAALAAMGVALVIGALTAMRRVSPAGGARRPGDRKQTFADEST